MNVLALDLGTKTGWAIHGDCETIRSGTWHLSDAKSIGLARAAGEDRKCDDRFAELCRQIEQAVDFHGIKAVVFEDVLFSSYTFQVQLWSALRAAIWAVARYHPIATVEGGARVCRFKIDCVNTSTLKKASTGRGDALKEMMAAYCLQRHPDEFIRNPKPTSNCSLLKKYDGARADDNEIDARLLLDYYSYLWRQ